MEEQLKPIETTGGEEEKTARKEVGGGYAQLKKPEDELRQQLKSQEDYIFCVLADLRGILAMLREEKIEEETPLTTEIKFESLRLDQFRHKLNELKEKYKLLGDSADALLEELSTKRQTLRLVRDNLVAEDLPQFTAETKNTIQKINEIWRQQAELLRFTQAFERTYKEEKLKEADFDSYAQVSQEYFDLRDKILALREQADQLERSFRVPILGGLMSKFANKARITKLDNQASQLEKRRHQLRLLLDLEHQQTYLPGISYTQRSRVTEVVSDLVAGTFETASDFYEQQLRTFERQEERKIELSQEVFDSLNDDFIVLRVMPRIEQEKKRLQRWAEIYPEDRKKLEALGDKNQIDKAIALLKESFSLSLHAPYDWSEEGTRTWEVVEKNVAEIQQTLGEIRQESGSLALVVEQFLPWKAEQPVNNYYQELVEFTAKHLILKQRSMVEDSYRRFVHDLIELVSQSHLPYEISRWKWKIHDKQRVLASSETNKRVDEFIEKLDQLRWEVFRNNKEIQRLLGEDKLGEADQFLEGKIIESLLGQKEHTEQSIQLGYKLLSFKGSEAIPIVILNAYREPGHSGEYPFIDVNLHPEETLLYQYISSLTEEQLGFLRRGEIPNLPEIITLIKANPQTFCQPQVEDLASGEYVDNPVYQEIEKRLERMITFYLKKNEPSIQYYLIGLVKRLPTRPAPLSRELSEELARVLQESKESKVQDALLDCFIWRIKDGDLKTADLFLGAYGNLEANSQTRIKEVSDQLFQAFIGKKDVSEQNLVVLSKILEVSVAQLSQTLNFLSVVVEQMYHQYQPRHFADYLRLATNPEVLPFLQGLRNYGYYFNIEHAETLLSIIKQKKDSIILTTLKEIKQSFPTFHYNFLPALIFNPETRTFTRDYGYDPYEVLINNLAHEKIIEGIEGIMERGGVVDRVITDGFLRALRNRDPLLASSEARKNIPEEQ